MKTPAQVNDDILRGVLSREGWPTISNRAADRGGLTKGGITAQTWGEYRQFGRPATLDEITAITEADALAFYASVFLVKPGYIDIRDDALRELMVDFAVNSGEGRATRTLQQCLRVNIDSVLGPITLAAANLGDAKAIYLRVWSARDAFLHDLALNEQAVVAFMRANPTLQLHNLRGWNNRLQLLITGAMTHG